MQISWKSLFFLSKINVFWVWSYQKSHQNQAQNTFEKKVVQKSDFECIWGRFLEVLEHQSASERPQKAKWKKHRKSSAKMTCQSKRKITDLGFRTPKSTPLYVSKSMYVKACILKQMSMPVVLARPGTDERCGGFLVIFGVILEPPNHPKSMKNWKTKVMLKIASFFASIFS